MSEGPPPAIVANQPELIARHFTEAAVIDSAVRYWLKAGQRANELTKGKDANVLDTLAKVYFDSGDSAKAIETETKALELVKGTKQEKDFQAKLDEYKKGVKAGSN